jgi:large subunit ribosomal protein L15
MDILSNLTYAKGSHKNKKRVGRGEGSGHGGNATNGMNGQLSRSGSKHRAWFEGGQMPLQRRIPKFGFTNIFKVYSQVLNVGDIQRALEEEKIKGSEITIEALYKAGLVSTLRKPVKILGNGEIKSKIKIDAHAFSTSAKDKIEAVGGSINKI